MMTKKITLLFTLMLSLVMVSCGSDDDNAPETPTAANVVLPGEYKGYTLTTCTHFTDLKDTDQTVNIIKEEDGSLTVSFISSTWGTYTINNVTATYSNGKYTLSGNGTAEMTNMSGNVDSYDCTFTGSVDAAKEEPTFIFHTTVMSGMDITFHLNN